MYNFSLSLDVALVDGCIMYIPASVTACNDLLVCVHIFLVLAVETC